MGIANALIASGAMDDEFVRRWTNAPLLVRNDTGKFLRERDFDTPASQTRFAVWDKARSRVDFSGAQAGDDTVDADLGENHDIAVTHESGSHEIVPCRPAFAIYTEALSPYSPDRAEEITGVSAKDVLRAAKMLGPGQRISHYASSRHRQHTNATQTARAIATLYALTGSFDRKGAN